MKFNNLDKIKDDGFHALDGLTEFNAIGGKKFWRNYWQCRLESEISFRDTSRTLPGKENYTNEANIAHCKSLLDMYK